jgi:histidyl-tRNA synthetase
MAKPSIAEGTRDFGPEQVRKRTYIFDTIRGVFQQFGFQPIETPAVENLSTLTGKYGEEGDRLLFKVLNNGDYLKDADPAVLAEKDSSKLTSQIAKRGLRYDLTVPFARYVVMNRGTLTFPFKRFQIQPVWRADRPQRGRYREFFQCDADVIGSESLHYEAELVQIYDEAFARLQLPVLIKVNNRKILYGIAEAANAVERFMDITMAIDKLDKIGVEGVRKELADRGLSDEAAATVESLLSIQDLKSLRGAFADSPTGLEGVAELERVFHLLALSPPLKNEFCFDISLARGLTYYTGCIFEVAAKDFQMGSIGGGGRYADLTGVFGVPGLSGVGISFGADRIYDVLEGKGLFPESLGENLKVLLATFDEATFDYGFSVMSQLRAAGIAAELYPEPGKLKKQFEHAAKRQVPFVAILGETELENATIVLKNQTNGEQETLDLAAAIERLR